MFFTQKLGFIIFYLKNSTSKNVFVFFYNNNYNTDNLILVYKLYNV